MIPPPQPPNQVSPLAVKDSRPRYKDIYNRKKIIMTTSTHLFVYAVPIMCFVQVRLVPNCNNGSSGYIYPKEGNGSSAPLRLSPNVK